jgi:hypothetical protein
VTRRAFCLNRLLLAGDRRRRLAPVGVNAANEDALRAIKGIGPARAKSILDERTAHGPFKDPGALAKRVKAMGGHTVERLQAEGPAAGPANAAGGAQAANAQDKAPAPPPRPRPPRRHPPPGRRTMLLRS